MATGFGATQTEDANMYRTLFPRDVFAELDRLQRELTQAFDLSPNIRGLARGSFPAINVGSIYNDNIFFLKPRVGGGHKPELLQNDHRGSYQPDRQNKLHRNQRTGKKIRSSNFYFLFQYLERSKA